VNLSADNLRYVTLVPCSPSSGATNLPSSLPSRDKPKKPPTSTRRGSRPPLSLFALHLPSRVALLLPARTMASSPVPSSPHAQFLPPIPPSPPRSFASTTLPAGSINLPAPPLPPLPGHFLTQTDVKASIAAYETLADAAKAYRKALVVLAQSASAFGAALETCARCMSTPPSPHSYCAERQGEG